MSQRRNLRLAMTLFALKPQAWPRRIVHQRCHALPSFVHSTGARFVTTKKSVTETSLHDELPHACATACWCLVGCVVPIKLLCFS